MWYALLQEAHRQILNTLIIPLIEPSYILVQQGNSEQAANKETIM